MGPSSPNKRGTAAPTFRRISNVVKRLDGSKIKMPLVMGIGLGNAHIVLDGDPAPHERNTAHSPLHFSANVYCDQRTGCIRVPLGTKVDLGPGNIALDGEPPPLRKFGKGYSSPCPHFSAHFALAWSPISATAELIFYIQHIFLIDFWILFFLHALSLFAG